MRIDTVKTKVYKFDELSDKAKEKALEQFRDINTDDNWYESVYETWKEKLEAMGYSDAEIMFSGFWSQGDGASFTCDSIDLLKWLKCHRRTGYYRILVKPIKEYSQLTASIERNNSHYVHERSISAVIHDDIYESNDKIEKKYIELEKELDLDAETLSSEIYKSLEKEYNYLSSDECVTEMIIANEYEFTVEGKQY